MAKNEKDIVKPIVLTDSETNDKYVLEFSRESVKFAEQRGFNVNEVDGITGLEDLFYYAFRMHHKSVSRDKAIKILYDKMGGFPDGMIERLGQLYAVPFESLVQDENAKNSKMTVEM